MTYRATMATKRRSCWIRSGRGGVGAAEKAGRNMPAVRLQEGPTGVLRQPGADPASVGTAGRSVRAAQQGGSALPGVGAEERPRLLLLELGSSGAGTGRRENREGEAGAGARPLHRTEDAARARRRAGGVEESG